jgi:hypothetical protein
MLLFNKYHRKEFFRDPHQGGPSGGATGNPGANQGGVTDPNAGGSNEPDPFEGINLDDLDAGARQILLDGKAKFAAAQKQLADEKKQREHDQQLARQFQGKYDQLNAQLQRINGGTPPANQADAQQQQLLAEFKKELMSKGVSEAQADIQAPLMLNMMETYGKTLKAEIGRDFSPFATSVMNNEALNAWHEAGALDKLGALQDPGIAGKVWADVQQMVAARQPVDAQTILNIRNIYYAAHVEATAGQPAGQPPVILPNTPPAFPSFGRTTFPGAGAAAYAPAPVDPNAPRHALDPATAAAISAVTANWKSGPQTNVTGKPPGKR